MKKNTKKVEVSKPEVKPLPKKETACCPPTAMKIEKKMGKTKIVAEVDCGFSNNLFVRGEGVSVLSWNKGIAMKNISPCRWELEIERPFTHAQFKLLLNDNNYEQGDNHTLEYGKEVTIRPSF